ncbi:hypothetical protein ACP4J4_02870 [Aureimonas ureilytica]|uniref:hypothetical protein n=1 Tax=Aureimonas ureilytica TaxID=401562 RepID=UPI003CF0EB8E
MIIDYSSRAAMVRPGVKRLTQAPQRRFDIEIDDVFDCFALRQNVFGPRSVRAIRVA